MEGFFMLIYYAQILAFTLRNMTFFSIFSVNEIVIFEKKVDNPKMFDQRPEVALSICSKCSNQKS